VHDSASFWALAQSKGNKTRIIGAELPRPDHPGQSNAGIIPGDITKPGRIGLVSKSGTLTYQMLYELRDIGFSSAVASAATRSSAHAHRRARRVRGRPDSRPDRDDR